MKISRGVLGILWFIVSTLIASCGDPGGTDFKCYSGITTIYIDIEGPGYLSGSEMDHVCNDIINFL